MNISLAMKGNLAQYDDICTSESETYIANPNVLFSLIPPEYSCFTVLALRFKNPDKDPLQKILNDMKEKDEEEVHSIFRYRFNESVRNLCDIYHYICNDLQVERFITYQRNYECGTSFFIYSIFIAIYIIKFFFF